MDTNNCQPRFDKVGTSCSRTFLWRDLPRDVRGGFAHLAELPADLILVLLHTHVRVDALAADQLKVCVAPARLWDLRHGHCAPDSSICYVTCAQ